MLNDAFLPDEVSALSLLLREALAEGKRRGLVIFEHIITKRLLHEAKIRGCADKDQLIAVALGEEDVLAFPGRWSERVFDISRLFRDRSA